MAVVVGLFAGTTFAADCAVPPEVGKKSGGDSFSFAFITDAHVTDNLVPVRDWELPAPREALTEAPFVGYQRALEEIKGRSVDFILDGGDSIDLNTFDGEKIVADDLEVVDKYINRILGIVESIGIPMYYTVGNHDLYEYPPATSDHPLFATGLFCKYFVEGENAYHSFDRNGWHFISLSSHDVLRNGWFSLGISDEQLEWLKSDLARVDRQTPIVLVSHIAFPNITWSEKRFFEGTGDAVYQIIKDHNVKLALFGHEHAYREFMWNNVPCVVGPSLSGSVWIDGRGGCSGKGKQGYLILTVAEGEITWKYHPFVYSLEQYHFEQTGEGSFGEDSKYLKKISYSN